MKVASTGAESEERNATGTAKCALVFPAPLNAPKCSKLALAEFARRSRLELTPAETRLGPV